MGADGIGSDDQSFQDQVRIAFQYGPVHEGPRVALIGIDDHILCFTGGLASSLPLYPRRKATTAPSSQTGFFDFLQNLLGCHLEKSLDQRRIPAHRQIVVDDLWIDLDV